MDVFLWIGGGIGIIFLVYIMSKLISYGISSGIYEARDRYKEKGEK